MVVMIDEGFDLGFKDAGQEVVFQQDAVLQSLMPSRQRRAHRTTFDLALGLRMIWRTAGVLHAFVLQPFSQLPRDVAGAVIAEEPWFVEHRTWPQPDASKAKSSVSVTSCVLMFPSRALLRNTLPGSGAKLPRDDVAAVIIQASHGLRANHCQLIDRAEIKPAPAYDLEIGEVGLPQLIDGRRLGFELTGRFDHNESRTGDQIVCLQYPIRRSL